jgi:hypothetical protein
MSLQSIQLDPQATAQLRGSECRIYARRGSKRTTSCQPVAARGDHDLKWPAHIRDVSLGGIGLVLHRRFEPGAGLAIELPESDGSGTFTVFARVVHVAAQAGGKWLLGCVFVSELNEDTLRAVLQSSPPPRSTPHSPETRSPAGTRTDRPQRGKRTLPRRVVAGVCLRVILPDGELVSRRVSRLHTAALWPLAAGTRVTIWPGRRAEHGAALQLRVTECTGHNGAWTVTCHVIGTPSEALLRVFRRPEDGY